MLFDCQSVMKLINTRRTVLLASGHITGFTTVLFDCQSVMKLIILTVLYC